VPVCIEAVRRDAEAATRAESASRLIDEVRFGLLRDPGEVARAAERFSVALGRPHVAAAFAYDGANERTWATALSWIETPVRQDRGLGWTILAADERELTRIRTRLQGMVGDDAQVLAACGSVVDDVHDTARSFFEAEAALALLRRGGRGVELRFSTLGLAGVLLSVPRERLRAFVDDQLGPILERADLLETLVAWLDTNGSRAAVAHRLDIHRNSVGYRMGRIRQLLACDPVEPATALQIQAALVAREMLAVLDELHDGQRGEPVNPLSD
jgi:sugar diacid utilization regulator